MLKENSSNNDYNDKGKTDRRLYLNLTKKILIGLSHYLNRLLDFAVWYVSNFYSLHTQATEF